MTSESTPPQKDDDMRGLPRDQPDVTGDAFKASLHERMPTNFTASHRLCFPKAAFDTATSGDASASYRSLAARMVASAWYPILYFRLNLGATDQLANVVNAAHRRLGLSRPASQNDVITAILSTDGLALTRQLTALCRYVYAERETIHHYT